MVRRCGAVLARLAIAAVGILALPASVLAVEASAAPATGGTSAVSVTTFTSDAMALIVIVLITAAVVSLGMLLWFNRDALQGYYDAALEVSKVGGTSEPEIIPGGGPGGDRAVATGPVKITGPTSGVVGVPAEYTATREVAWTIAPDAAGAVNPTRGKAMKFTPAKAQIVTVTATAEGTPPDALQVAVIEAARTTKLPFVGRGYGSIAIGVIAIFAVLGLGLSGRLGPEALATFFGGLLGIGAARATSGGGSSDGGSGGGSDT